MHVIVCMCVWEFRDDILLRGEECKPEKIRKFHSSEKPEKFSRSQMTKRTSPLDLS